MNEEKNLSSPSTELDLRILLEISRLLSSSIELTRILEIIIKAIIEKTKVDRGVILLLDREGKLRIKEAMDANGTKLDNKDLNLSKSVIKDTLTQKKPVIIYDTQQDINLQKRESIVNLHLRAIMGIPLIVTRPTDKAGEGRVIGLIYVDSKRTLPGQAERTLSFIQALASNAAVAIDNSRLVEEAIEKRMLEKEMKIAAEIQRKLLPQAYPKDERLEFYAQQIPLKQVGGDYYDFIELKNGEIAIAIGDVAGKGLSAALIMAGIQASVRALIETNIALPSLLNRINAVIQAYNIENKLTTLFLGVIDKKLKLSYCTAGHLPPLLIRKDRSMVKLSDGGMILGVMENPHYKQGEVQLTSGDNLIAFTDGILEQKNEEGEIFGARRFINTLLKNLHKEVPQIVEELFAELNCFQGRAPQVDDLTIFIIRVK